MKTTRRAQTRQVAESGLAERAAPLEVAPDEFRRLGHDLVDRIADFFGTLRERPLTSGETPAEIRALLGRGPLPAGGSPPAALLAQTAPPPVRALAVQRPSPVHGVHHLFGRADRRAGRPARGHRESERRRMGALADGVGDRGADRTLGGRARGLSGGLRWAAGERRQHGQLRLLSRGPPRRCWARRRGPRGWRGRRRRSGSTPPRPPTPGSRRRATCSAWAPGPSAGFPWTRSSACAPTRSRRRSAPTWRARRPADHGHRHGRQREHRRRGSAARAGRHLPDARALVPRGRRLRRAGRGAARRARRSPRAGPGRLARGGPAQVAVRAARGRVRAGARAASADARPSATRRHTIASRPRARSRRSTTTSSACRTAAASARSRCGSGCARRGAKGTRG